MIKRLFLALISFYRRRISPLTPPKCKYYPTCSSYAYTAIERFGALKGSALAVWRLLRCNPWSMGGIDHVPEKFTFKRQKFDYSTLNDDDGQSHDKDRA